MKYLGLNENASNSFNCVIDREDLSLLREAITENIKRGGPIFKIKQFIFLFNDLIDIESKLDEEYFKKLANKEVG